MENQRKNEEKDWSIETYLRIRPPLGSKNNIKYDIQTINDRSIVEIDIPSDADPGLVHNNSATGKLKFEFDNVFDIETSQDAVFETIAHSKVREALDGINCTIFAYGQTGSGKTYTICGGDSYKVRGLIPRTIGLIFEEVKIKAKNQKPYTFKCQISFTEIYKEVVYDLLNPARNQGGPETWPNVEVLEGENGILVRNLSVYDVTCEEDALQLFFMGNNNRITASTAMNMASSRSHAVFTAVLQSEFVEDGKTVFTAGKINLVDLAGSERMYKMHNTKSSMDEGKSINKSLHFLEQVVVSLREQALHAKRSSASSSRKAKDQQLRKSLSLASARNSVVGGPSRGSATEASQNSFIPYRNSVLTSMLRDSLGGNCKSCFVVTMTVERVHFEESIATCRFAQRCGEVKVHISANTEIGLPDQLKELTARLKVLERQLQLSEESNQRLEQLLEEERELREMQIDSRLLSDEEKTECKHCVQQLLATAKDALHRDMSAHPTAYSKFYDTDAEIGLAESPDAKRSIDAALEESQDVLYDTVEQMDRAVLVELTTSLGTLIQSMFIEREIHRKTEAMKKEMQDHIEEEKNQDILEQEEKEEISNKASPNQVQNLSEMPKSALDLIRKGSIFVKFDRFGRKAILFVHVSADLENFCYRKIGANSKKGAQIKSVPLKWFTRVTHKPGKKAKFGCFRGNASIPQDPHAGIESQPTEDLEAEFQAFRMDRDERKSTHSSIEADSNDQDEDGEDDEEEDEETQQYAENRSEDFRNQLFLHCRHGQYKSIHLEIVDKGTLEENVALARHWKEALSYLLHRQKTHRLSSKGENIRTNT